MREHTIALPFFSLSDAMARAFMVAKENYYNATCGLLRIEARETVRGGETVDVYEFTFTISGSEAK